MPAKTKEMHIPTWLLFSIPTIMWGVSWTVIKMQEGEVDAMVSVSYRFFIASCILFAYLLIKKERLFSLSLADHGFIYLQGIFLFATNYWLFYLSEYHVSSGVVAFIFSTVVFMNLVNGSIILRKKLEKALIGTGLLGLLGMIIIFFSDIRELDFQGEKFWGFILAVAATFLASLGNVLSAYNQNRGIKVSVSNAYGMLYGAASLLIVAIVTAKNLALQVDLRYLGSLLFLSIFASVFAFGAYIKLIGRIGPERAAYISFVFPIIALLLSSILESYTWGWFSIIGIFCILGSNYLLLKIKKIH